MKKFSIAGSILKRPITVIMVSLVFIGFGIFSLSKLKITMFPSFNIPIVAISTGYGDVPPADMVPLLAEPLEGAVSSIEGIEEIESNVSKGNLFIRMRLEEGVNPRNVEQDIRDAIGRIRNELPEEAQEPVIFQFDPENFPIMDLSLEAENRGLDKLRTLSIEFVEQRLERIPGVAAADTRGGLERKIKVMADPMSLSQHNLVPADIENALRQNNVQVPVGNVVSGKSDYSIRALSTYQSVEDIRQTIIQMSDNGIPIRVSDVAEVEDGFSEVNTIVRINGRNTVTLEVQKKSDANTLDVVNAVKAELSNINDKLPPGVMLNVRSDQGREIENSIMNLTQTALIALVVVIFILFIFMGDWRVATIVATVIPISVTVSFAAMFFFEITLNIFTITALALAIGLLVDNSIVVTESIARKLEEGYSRYQSSLQGTNEVIGALFGATLTTLGVFVPIVGLSGIQAQLFVEFALTISIAIIFSFVSSIILVPVLSHLLLKPGVVSSDNLTSRAVGFMENYYTGSLRWLLRHKWVGLLSVIVFSFGIYGLYQGLNKQSQPPSDSGKIDIDLELPSGTKLVKTGDIMNRFSSQLNGMEEVETIITRIGRSRWSQQTNLGEISVSMVEADKRDISTQEFSLKLKRMIEAPGVEVDIDIRDGGFGGGSWGGGGNRIRLSLIGPDVEVLQGISGRIEQLVSADSNVISVNNGRSDPTPELHYYVDRLQINKMGTSLQEVANSLKSQVQGTRVGFFREGGREIPIEFKTAENTISSRDELNRLELVQINNQRLPVQALGNLIPYKGVDSIERRNRQTVLDVNILVSGNIMEYRQKIVSKIQNNIVLPDGYRFEFTGSTRATDEETREMNYALIFAVLLMFMIMASLFENFIDPFIIWFSIPLAMFGALAGLYFTGTPLASSAYIGVFMLVGIIVNNGIVLVDYIHLYDKFKEHSDTLLNNAIEACRRRLRPILLTALTTICSMIPLSFGFGSGGDVWAPLARAVIGGLFFGTVLTLYIVPVFVLGLREFITFIKSIPSYLFHTKPGEVKTSG